MGLEKAMAPHSSTFVWKIPWMEEPGRLQSVGSLGVRHDWSTSLSLFTFMHWRRKWQPTPVFLPGESQGWGAWWAAVYGVSQSRTRLKQISSSSSIYYFPLVCKILGWYGSCILRYIYAILFLMHGKSCSKNWYFSSHSLYLPFMTHFFRLTSEVS